MKDILLTADGDRMINDRGDVSLTDSVRQSVKIRLLWFFGEWRFAPKFGIPYYDEILVKNPSLERIKRIVRDEAMTVNEVRDVRNIIITVNKPERTALISLDVVTAEETYRDEVIINV